MTISPTSPPATAPAAPRPPAVPTVRMVQPIVGFEELSRFILVAVGHDDPLPDLRALRDNREVLFELCSVEQPHVRFLVAVPTAFFPGYAFDLDTPLCEALELDTPDDALTLVILTISGSDGLTTANLVAPVVINSINRRAAQVIVPAPGRDVRTVIE